MDASRFDRLARAVAGSHSRRRTLAALLAAALPAVATAKERAKGDEGRAAAKDRGREADDGADRRPGARSPGGRDAAEGDRQGADDREQTQPRVAQEQSPDRGALAADGADRAGDAGAAAEAACTATGKPCAGAACRRCCSGTAIKAGGDRLCWCRGKGATCAANGECCTGRCQGGACSGAITAAGQRCNSGDRCPRGTTCQAYTAGSGGKKGTYCLRPDRKPCGRAAECAANACPGGVCGAACEAAAGTVCPAGEPECCASGCADTETDAENCGACGDACAPGGDRCAGGECFCGVGAACAAGSCCPTGCKDTETDFANCGACGKVCDPVANGAPGCVDGTCSIGFCNDGFRPCNGNSADGCETDIRSDARNCGGCGVACPGLGQPNTDVRCQNQRCELTCQGRFYDVDGNAANGCEVSDFGRENHTQGSAAGLADERCFDDESTTTFSGTIPSDARTHVPAVPGFDPATGAAPDWWRVRATGGSTCVNDLWARIKTSGGAAGACYRLRVITDRTTLSTAVSGNNAAGAVVTSGSSSYSDGSDIYFVIDKTCGTSVLENLAYTVEFHL